MTNVSTVNIEVKRKVRGRPRRTAADLAEDIYGYARERGSLRYKDIAQRWPVEFRRGNLSFWVQDCVTENSRPGDGLSERGLEALQILQRRLKQQHRWRIPAIVSAGY